MTPRNDDQAALLGKVNAIADRAAERSAAKRAETEARRAANRAAYPEFAAFIDAMRAEFGEVTVMEFRGNPT